MSARFTGKSVIVTGSSNGIGRETALLFAREGAKVTITGRSVNALEETKKAILALGLSEDRVLAVQGDLTKEYTLKAIVDQTVAKFGGIDVLVNNAGGAGPDMSGMNGFDESIDLFDYVINLNVKAVLQLTKLAMPHLVKAKGEVVMVSSIAGLKAACLALPYYASSKAALDQLTRALAIHYISEGVRINSVNPGFVMTNIWEKQGMTVEMTKNLEEVWTSDRNSIPIGRSGAPRDIAEAIAFLADRSKSEFIVGQNLVVDGGSSIMCPIMCTNLTDKINAK